MAIIPFKDPELNRGKSKLRISTTEVQRIVQWKRDEIDVNIIDNTVLH